MKTSILNKKFIDLAHYYQTIFIKLLYSYCIFLDLLLHIAIYRSELLFINFRAYLGFITFLRAYFYSNLQFLL